MKSFARLPFILIPLLQVTFLPAQTAPAKLTKQTLQTGIAQAVVELIALGPGGNGNNRECQATGFLVNERGYILTNSHVVDEARDCLAGASPERILAKPMTADPTTASAVPCRLVILDDLHDLAVLKTLRPLFPKPSEAVADAKPDAKGIFLPLDPGAVEDGTAVSVVGHPDFTWHAEMKSGRIVGRGTTVLSDTSSQKSDVLYLDIPLLKGSSGSPVYRASDGSVVGIVERKDLQHRGRTIVVPIRYAIELLDRAGVKWHSAQASAEPK
jgi:S1-C subfamily serine protease